MATPTNGSSLDDAPASGRIQTVVLAVAPIVVLGLGVFAIDDNNGRSGGGLTLLLVVLPLLVRRRWPIPVFFVISAGAVMTSVATGDPWVEVAAVVLASFTVGELATDRIRSALVVVGVAALMPVGFALEEAASFETAVLPFIVLIPSWFLGDIVRSRRIEAAARAEAIERSLREREERLRSVAAEERRHVARELHDIVAHAVSVMVIQAGAARQVIRTRPAEAEEALLAVETTGREAMTELRRFLGALSDDDEPAGLAPQPGIEALPALVERVRDAGLPASLEVDGVPRAVPSSLDVTVYRIAQEALTNALRYARMATTLVKLSWEPEQLRVEILDDGPATGEAGSSGRGLVGMAERASLVGGRLEAGPRLGGGYAVRAWLPLEAGRSVDPKAS